MADLPGGRHFFRGDDGYEQARAQTVWNARTPERYPDVVVQAVDADEVVAAVRYAARHDMRIGVRSGGHSWAGNHVRDGGMLLDVSRLDDCEIDTDTGTAVVGPGMGGSVLAGRLDRQGLFFPAGHCKGVRIGGYLLQGGYGWNSRVLGPACESVLGLDVVTADGELVTPGLGTILDGVTRDSVLDLAAEHDLKPVERPVSLADLRAGCDDGSITEMFAAGTAAIITPILGFKGNGYTHTLGDGEPGERTLAIRRHILDVQFGRAADSHNWLVPVLS